MVGSFGILISLQNLVGFAPSPYFAVNQDRYRMFLDSVKDSLYAYSQILTEGMGNLLPQKDTAERHRGKVATLRDF